MTKPLRTALALALTALGGTAAAQPTTSTPTTNNDSTASPTTSPTSSPTTSPMASPTMDDQSPSSTSTTVIVPPVDATPPPAPIAPPTTVYVAPAPMPYVEHGDESRGMYEKYGVALALGGGVEGFTGSSARDTTKDGGNWDVRLTVGTRSPLALEASYIGSAQSIDALGLGSSALLVGNGAQADARLNFADFVVQPFAFGGVAWKRYSIQNSSSNTSDLVNNDDVLEVPLGVGVASKWAGFMVDVRGEYRFLTQADLMDRTNPDARMDRWGVNANVGYAF